MPNRRDGKNAWLHEKGVNAMTLLKLVEDFPEINFALCKKTNCEKAVQRANSLRYFDIDICENNCHKLNPATDKKENLFNSQNPEAQ